MSAGETLQTREDVVLARLRQGDKNVLGELFALHRERLWRVVRFRMDHRLAGRIDADDVLQEAFLSASSRIDSFLSQAEGSFYVWLRLIMMQTLFDLHRRHIGAEMRDARRDVRLDAATGGSSTSNCLAACLAASLTSPSQAVAGLELTQRLEQAIASMAPLDQEIISLRHFEDLTNLESAEVLAISPTAASNRYVRAIARLKDILTRFPEFRG